MIHGDARASTGAAAPATPPRARVERDFLGEKAIPAGAYWGVHTTRSGWPASRSAARRREVLLLRSGVVEHGAGPQPIG